MKRKKRHFASRSITCESLEERALLAVLSGDLGSAFETNETLAGAADLGSVTGSNPFSSGNVQIDARIGDWDGTNATNLTDIDIYRVDLKAGDLVTFDVDAQRLDDGSELCDPESGTSSNADNVLRLFRIPAEGGFTELASNDAAIAPGDATDGNTLDPAIVDFVVPTTGTYYVGVSGHSDAGNDYDPVNTANRNATQHTGQYVLSISAVDDDNRTPEINVTPPSDTDGGDNVVRWTIADESGVVSQTARIWKDGVIVRPEAPVELEGEFDLAPFGPGDYRITINAVDGDNDYPGDQLTNIHSVLFTINDDDVDPPEVVIIPSISSDGANNIVEWRSIDDSGISSVLVNVFKNDELIHENTTDSNGSFDLNEQGIGEYRVTVSATDADTDRDNDQLTQEVERTFSITDDDTIKPTVLVDSPANSDGAENIASWNASDVSGISAVDVRISRDGEVLFEGQRSPVDTYNLDDAGLGNYEVTVTAIDADNDWVGDQLASDTVTTQFSVSDDDVVGPVVTIAPPSNNDGVDNVVSWLASDQSGISQISAVIQKDGDQIFSGNVTAEDSFDLNTFGVGNFVITVTAVDGDNDWDGDSLTVTESAEFSIIDDDQAAPNVDIQVSQALDGVGNFFSWNITDPSGITTNTAVITRDGETIFEGGIELSDKFEIDAEGLGAYAITITSTDADNDWDGDTTGTSKSATLSIADDDTQGPEVVITGPDPTDGDDNQISWRVTDQSGLAEVLVTVSANGETLRSGTADPAGSLDLNALGLVDVSIEVTATDADNDWEADALTTTQSATFTIVDDDDRAPTLQINERNQVDGEDNSVSWQTADPSGLSEVYAELYREGVRVFEGVVSALDEINLNEFAPGEFQIVVRSTDADNDWQDGTEANDTRTSLENETFFITDDDTELPVITISTPDESDGIDNTVSWKVTDDSGVSNVTLEVIFNGNSIDTRTVSADDSFDANSLGIGEYQIIITAVDGDSDWSGDQLEATANATFTVVDDDTDGPDIDLQVGGRLDGEDNTTSWSASDNSGISSITATLSKDGAEIESRVGAGSFNLNSLGLGSYEVSVTAVDADSDWDGDQSQSTIVQSFSITDDDVRAPLITISPADGTTEPADLPNQFVWTVTDAGGIGSVSVSIERQEGGNFVAVSQKEIDTAGNPTALTGQESVDALGFGVFRIGITATDADNDRAGDALSNQGFSTLEIADGTAPTVISSDHSDVAVPLTPGVVDFIFSEDVSESLDPSDVILRNLSTGEDMAVTQDFTWNAAEMKATLDLTSMEGLDIGLYTVILRSSGITDRAGNALDGNNSGTSGGDYENELIRFPVTWRGDADRDVEVEFEDFLVVSTNLGNTGELWTGGDFTGDGAVLFEDFLWVSVNFGNNAKPA